MNFNDYWNKKVAKRRKAWAARAKRYAESHNQLEEIRKEVYLPLDFNANYNLDDLIPIHFTEHNPIMKWDKGVFSFSEKGLRAAMTAQGADMGTFRMELERESIKGNAAPLPEDSYGINKWEEYLGLKPNRVYDFDRYRFNWLLRMYGICTDLVTVRLYYERASMSIRRFSNADRPFGYYEINPCEQLCHSAILLQESDFYTLDVATLLMDMAGEWDLRHEELNYYAKKLRLRSMEAATTDSINFTPWEEKKVIKKTEEYIAKGYNQEKIVRQLLSSWKSAVKKFFDAQTELAIKEDVVNLTGFDDSRSSSKTFIESVFCPFIEKDGDDAVEIVIASPYDITIKISGSQCRMKSTYDGIFFYPNAHFESCFFILSLNTPLKAISDYMKMMPTINPKADEIIVTAMHQYDRLVLQNEKYHSDIELLDGFAQKFARKPVGKMMKHLRWHVETLSQHPYRPFPFSTIQIQSDTTFSYQIKGTTVERWLDAECHTIYASDPATVDEEARMKALSPVGYPRADLWSETLDDFMSWFVYYSYSEFLSIDFIDKYL